MYRPTLQQSHFIIISFNFGVIWLFCRSIDKSLAEDG